MCTSNMYPGSIFSAKILDEHGLCLFLARPVESNRSAVRRSAQPERDPIEHGYRSGTAPGEIEETEHRLVA